MIPRDAVFDSERRQIGSADPQRMDFRSIIERRLICLQYLMNDQGAVVDTSGNVIVDAGDSSGTGQTPAELAANGYTPDQIAQLAGSMAPNVSGALGGAAIGGSGTPSGTGTTSWISGLAGLFGTVGSTVTNIQRAQNNPNINPQTGVRYGVNPATGLPYTAATGQVSILLIVVVVVVLWVVFGGKARV